MMFYGLFGMLGVVFVATNSEKKKHVDLGNVLKTDDFRKYHLGE